MKTIASAFLSLILILFLILALPISGEEEVYDSIVRLHVLPKSDSAVDQNLKILVRDALLAEYGEALGELQSKEEAEEYLEASRPEIEAFVNNFLKEKGEDACAVVSLKEEFFETRTYGEVTLPSGHYTSLTVTIGEGEGQNWWCVLYPALCTEAAMGECVSVAEEQLSESEYRLVTDSGYLLKFRTLEILESVFGK